MWACMQSFNGSRVVCHQMVKSIIPKPVIKQLSDTQKKDFDNHFFFVRSRYKADRNAWEWTVYLVREIVEI